jgi:hypothetical protein
VVLDKTNKRCNDRRQREHANKARARPFPETFRASVVHLISAHLFTMLQWNYPLYSIEKRPQKSFTINEKKKLLLIANFKMTYVKPVKYISQAICKERRQLIKQRLHGGHVITVWLK